MLLVKVVRFRRCYNLGSVERKTAYKSRLPATARFKESAPPTIGMRTICWQSDRCSSVSPERSWPNIKTVGRAYRTLSYSTTPSGDAPITESRCLFIQLRKRSILVRTSVCLKRAPIVDRTTTGSYGSICWPSKINPAAPIAAEVRKSVPKLPSD